MFLNAYIHFCLWTVSSHWFLSLPPQPKQQFRSYKKAIYLRFNTIKFKVRINTLLFYLNVLNRF
nr:MAG TPA: hypothetical protein [Caudoviricetes sp.]